MFFVLTEVPNLTPAPGSIGVTEENVFGLA